MLKRNLFVFISVVSLLFSGCSSKANFAHTPTKQADFTKPMETLKQEYSDIEEYDRIFASPKNAPKLAELEEKWGEPEKTTQWLGFGFSIGVLIACAVVVSPAMLTLYLLNPMPSEQYTWKKGNYTINAQGRKGAFVRYEETIGSWEWESNESSVAE